MKNLLGMHTGCLSIRKPLTGSLMFYGSSWDEDCLSLHRECLIPPWYDHARGLCCNSNENYSQREKYICISKDGMPFRHQIQGNTFNMVISWSNNWKKHEPGGHVWMLMTMWLIQQIMICQPQNFQFSATSIACYTSYTVSCLPQCLLAFWFPDPLLSLTPSTFFVIIWQ